MTSGWKVNHVLSSSRPEMFKKPGCCTKVDSLVNKKDLVHNNVLHRRLTTNMNRIFWSVSEMTYINVFNIFFWKLKNVFLLFKNLHDCFRWSKTCNAKNIFRAHYNVKLYGYYLHTSFEPKYLDHVFFELK